MLGWWNIHKISALMNCTLLPPSVYGESVGCGGGRSTAALDDIIIIINWPVLDNISVIANYKTTILKLKSRYQLNSISTMMPVIEIMLPGAPVQSQIAGNVPAFLAKLWKMVDNPDTGEWRTYLEAVHFFSSYSYIIYHSLFFLSQRVNWLFMLSIFRLTDILVGRWKFLYHQESVRVHQVDVTLLLQTLQHGLIHSPAEHVRLPQGHECRVRGTQGMNWDFREIYTLFALYNIALASWRTLKSCKKSIDKI